MVFGSPIPNCILVFDSPIPNCNLVSHIWETHCHKVFRECFLMLKHIWKNIQRFFCQSSRSLFFYPIARQRCWAVMSFIKQFENRLMMERALNSIQFQIYFISIKLKFTKFSHFLNGHFVVFPRENYIIYLNL